MYVEVRRGTERLETWLPVVFGSDESVTRQNELYVRRVDSGAPATQIIAGLIFVLVAVSVTGRVAATVRATNSRPNTATLVGRPS